MLNLFKRKICKNCRYSSIGNSTYICRNASEAKGEVDKNFSCFRFSPRRSNKKYIDKLYLKNRNIQNKKDYIQ